MTNQFMLEAINLSQKNIITWLWWPFGAVIVKDGKIVGKWSNAVTSENDPTAHAEIQAIRNACKNLDTFSLENCEIYTNCEPCPMCYGAISRARINKIYYANTEYDAADIGFDDSVFYEDIKKDFNKRNIPVEQIDHNEALKVFQQRKEKQDKIEY